MLLPDQIDEYIFLYYKQELTPEQLQELQEWLAKEPDHEKYFREMLKVYGQIRLVRNWEHLEQVQHRMWKRLQGRISRHIRWKTGMRVAGVAAVFLLGIGVWWWQSEMVRSHSVKTPVAHYEAGSAKAILHLASGEEIPLTQEAERQVAVLEGVTMRQDTTGRLLVEDRDEKADEIVTMHTITVPPGGEYQIILADGTKVWLNSDTRLTFPSRFAGDRRRVELTGEAYFEVVSDALHPFEVKTDRTNVEVLGTAFNVASYENTRSVAVALLRGKVALNSETERVVLKPGEIADVNRADGKTRVREGDVEAIIAWTSGRFNFDNMPLEELLPQLERWYEVKFEFDDETCRALCFTGAVTKYRELNYILEMISSMSTVTFSERDGIIHVQKK